MNTTNRLQQTIHLTTAVLLLGLVAGAVQASSPGSLSYNGTTLELEAAVAVLNPEGQRLKIWLLPFEPSPTELDKLLHDDSFWIDDDRPNPDPDRYQRVPYAFYSMSWSLDPEAFGDHDAAFLFLYTHGLDGDYGQLNINLLPGEAAGTLGGVIEEGKKTTLTAKGEHTMDEHHLAWQLDLEAEVHELQHRPEPEPEEPPPRKPGQEPLVGSTAAEKAAIKQLEQTYGEVSVLTLPWALNPRRPDSLRLFLEAGIDVESPIEIVQEDQTYTLTPLQYTLSFACGGEETAEVVRILLAAGADPNRHDPISGSTVLMQVATWEQCAGIVAQLLAAGADPNLSSNNGDTAMTWAIRNGSLEEMKLLLDAGFKVDPGREQLIEMARHEPDKQALLRAQPEPPSYQSMAEAIEHLDLEATRSFLKSGASASEPVDGEPPLIHLTDACRWKDTTVLAAMIDLLLANGADVKATGGPLQTTPLGLAASSCPVGIVNSLLAAGADPNVEDAAMHSPLFAAVFADRPEAVDALLDGGAKVDRDAKFFANNKPNIKALLKKKRKRR